MEHGRKKALDYALLTLVILGCVFLLHQMSPMFRSLWEVLRAVLTPFLIAIMISYLLNPVVGMLSRRGVPRTASVLIIYIVFFALLAIAVVNAVPVFVEQVKQFVDTLPDTVASAEKWVNTFTDGTRHLPDGIRNSIDHNLNSLEKRISGYTSDMMGIIGDMLEQILIASSIPFLTFYMLKDLKVLEKTVIKVFPNRHRNELIHLLKSIDEALGSYIRGQLLVMILVGIVTYTGYLIIHIPFGLLLALIVAITNIIPYVGPFIGAAPALVVAFTVSPMMAAKVALVNVIVQILEGNFLSPSIVGRSLSLHPLLIILALLIGGEIGGVMGLIIAVPVVAVTKVVLEHVVLHFTRR